VRVSVVVLLSLRMLVMRGVGRAEREDEVSVCSVVVTGVLPRTLPVQRGRGHGFGGYARTATFSSEPGSGRAERRAGLSPPGEETTGAKTPPGSCWLVTFVVRTGGEPQGEATD